MKMNIIAVVQLFNAIAKQQAEIENADVKNEEEGIEFIVFVVWMEINCVDFSG